MLLQPVSTLAPRSERAGPPTSRPRRRAGAAFAALVLSATVGAVAPDPASGQASTPVGFTEGEWVGSFSYLGSTELGGVPVRYRAVGTFGLVSSYGGTTGLWDLSLVTVIPGSVANATAGGAAEGEGMIEVALSLDTMTARDSTSGMTIKMTGDEIPDAGAGTLIADSTMCHSLSGRWEIPFGGTVLAGDFVAHRTDATSMAPEWQALQQSGLDLLLQIDEGEVPLEAMRIYLQDAEIVMGSTTERTDPALCDEATMGRFRTAALALGDALIGALATRIDELTDDELIEVMRTGVRSGAFVIADLEYPYNVELVKRMTQALTDDDLGAMEYWFPVAVEFGRNDVATLLQAAIEDAR